MATTSVRPDTKFGAQDRSTAPGTSLTAHKLERLYASQKDADSWQPSNIGEIAWVSNQVARAQVCQALGILVEPCELKVNSCTHAPKGQSHWTRPYMGKATVTADQQFAKAEFGQASSLNGMWPGGAVIQKCALAK
jgi:hypothetical protein